LALISRVRKAPSTPADSVELANTEFDKTGAATTLGSSLGQINRFAHAAKRRRTALALAGGSGLVAVAAIVAVIAAARSGSDYPSHPAADADAPAAQVSAAEDTRPPRDTVATPPRAQGTLSVRINRDDASIRVDDLVIATKVDGARVDLDVGEHAVEVSAPRRATFRQTVTIAAGSVSDLQVELQPKPVDAKPAGVAEPPRVVEPPTKPAEATKKPPDYKRPTPKIQ
jgi:hypothetical protein